jgi:hypothetical protein
MQTDPSWGRTVAWSRKNVKPLLAGLAAVAGCFYIARWLTVERLASGEVNVTPFILETEVYSFEKDPAGGLVERKTTSRRSDGATAVVQNLGPIEWGETARRVTYADSRSVTFVDSFRTKTTWPVATGRELASFKEQFLHPSRNCVRVGEALVGFGKASGKDVAIVRASLRGERGPASPGEERRITYWRVPDLACQTLTYRVDQEKGDGSWQMLTEERVVILKLQEPDARLFDHGSGYTEVKPSEVEKRLLDKAGVSQDAEPWKTEKERLDKGYSRASRIR